MIERVRSRLRIGGEAGYSLVEMLTVMVIMSIVFAGITDIFVAGSKASAEQDRRFQAQLSTRLALDKIRRDIHCASDVTPYSTSSATLKITACGGGDITLVHRRRHRLHESLRALPAGRNHVRLIRYQDRRLPDLRERIPGVRAHGRLRLSRLFAGRLHDQPEGQRDDRHVRPRRHHLPAKQHEDLT